MIEDDLIRHEGYEECIYLCSEGHRTIGIGHLILPTEPEYKLDVGDCVSTQRVEQLFVKDLEIAFEESRRLVEDLDERPLNVQRVVVNMMFNLGYPRLSKFKRMLAAIKESDYARAAKEMEDSKWYHQVGRRSKELVRLMEWVENENL